MSARATRLLTLLPVLALTFPPAGCATAEERGPALEPVVAERVWQVSRDRTGHEAAGYLLRTEVGLVGLDLREGDPTPDGAVPVLLIDSIAPLPANAYHAAPDTPRHTPASLDVETVLELGEEKLHLIPVPGPTGQRVLIVWAARSGLVLAPALLDPVPGAAPTDRAAWEAGLAVLRNLTIRVLLPDPGRAVTELDAGWMRAVRP